MLYCINQLMTNVYKCLLFLTMYYLCICIKRWRMPNARWRFTARGGFARNRSPRALLINEVCCNVVHMYTYVFKCRRMPKERRGGGVRRLTARGGKTSRAESLGCFFCSVCLCTYVYVLYGEVDGGIRQEHVSHMALRCMHERGGNNASMACKPRQQDVALRCTPGLHRFLHMYIY